VELEGGTAELAMKVKTLEQELKVLGAAAEYEQGLRAKEEEQRLAEEEAMRQTAEMETLKEELRGKSLLSPRAESPGSRQRRERLQDGMTKDLSAAEDSCERLEAELKASKLAHEAEVAELKTELETVSTRIAHAREHEIKVAKLEQQVCELEMQVAQGEMAVAKAMEAAEDPDKVTEANTEPEESKKPRLYLDDTRVEDDGDFELDKVRLKLRSMEFMLEQADLDLTDTKAKYEEVLAQMAAKERQLEEAQTLQATQKRKWDMEKKMMELGGNAEELAAVREQLAQMMAAKEALDQARVGS